MIEKKTKSAKSPKKPAQTASESEKTETVETVEKVEKATTSDKKRKFADVSDASDSSGAEDSSPAAAATSSNIVNLSAEDIKKGSFSNFPLTEPTITILKKKGIDYLFPIQVAVFNHIYEGKDLVGRAKTGTGKTLSFVLPIVERLRKEPRSSARGRPPKVLVMTPTRELAKQVHGDFELFAPNLMKTMVVYGGVEYRIQEKGFWDGIDVIVGTPGRLIDHLERGNLLLNHLEYIILDEADQMLDIGFADSMDKLLSAAKEATRENNNKIQTCFFSATMPAWVKNAVKKYCQQELVSIDLVGNSESKSAQNIEFFAIKCSWQERASTLRDVLTVYSSGRTIIFTETKAEANQLILDGNVKEAQVLHGDIPQNQREQTLKGFREGKFSILIATDVAARGLDVPEVELVIQLEPPKDVETFIHRSGRTARAGKSGVCIIFFKPQQQYMVATIEKQAGICFKRIGAPQPQQIIQKVALQTIKDLSKIGDSVTKQFQEPVKLLLEQFEGNSEKALAAALAQLSGYSASVSSRSLLSSMADFVAYQIDIAQEMRSKSYIWAILDRTVGPDIKTQIKGLRMLASKKGAVFDVPARLEPELLAKWGERPGAGATLTKPTELPELADDDQDQGRRNSFGGGGGGNSRFGGGGGRNNYGGGRSDGGGRGFGGRSGAWGGRSGGGDAPAPKRVKF